MVTGLAEAMKRGYVSEWEYQRRAYARKRRIAGIVLDVLLVLSALGAVVVGWLLVSGVILILGGTPNDH